MYSFIYVVLILVLSHMLISYINREKYVLIKGKTAPNNPVMVFSEYSNKITALKSKAGFLNNVLAFDTNGNMFEKIELPLVEIQATIPKAGLYVKEKHYRKNMI